LNWEIAPERDEIVWMFSVIHGLVQMLDKKALVKAPEQVPLLDLPKACRVSLCSTYLGTKAALLGPIKFLQQEFPYFLGVSQPPGKSLFF
jgi:hypothetical protein